MKRYRFYIGIIAVALFVIACSKDDDDPTVEAWKLANEQAFKDVAKNPEFTELKSPGNNGSLYYRVIKKGEGKRIYYNSRAEVYYKGWYVVTNADKNIKAGTVFDQRLFDDGVTFKVAVSSQVIDNNGVYASVVEGWSIALQHMVEGDKWEVWLPSHFGYGKFDYKGIPGGSTLAFEIELVKAIDPNEF